MISGGLARRFGSATSATLAPAGGDVHCAHLCATTSFAARRDRDRRSAQSWAQLVSTGGETPATFVISATVAGRQLALPRNLVGHSLLPATPQPRTRFADGHLGGEAIRTRALTAAAKAAGQRCCAGWPGQQRYCRQRSWPGSGMSGRRPSAERLGRGGRARHVLRNHRQSLHVSSAHCVTAIGAYGWVFRVSGKGARKRTSSPPTRCLLGG